MKKLLLTLFSLVVFLAFANISFAAEKNIPFTYEEIVGQYNLPYPGLLPDNRFYFFKMIRDRIVGIIISDPIKKADFDILEADKRLSTGIYLFTSGEQKNQLATSTISKGENYFVDASLKIQLAKQQGIGVSEIKGRLSDSLKKHQEILRRLETKFSGTVKEELQQEEQKVGQLQKNV